MLHKDAPPPSLPEQTLIVVTLVSLTNLVPSIYLVVTVALINMLCPPLLPFITTCDRLFKSCVAASLHQLGITSHRHIMIRPSLLLLPSLALSLPTSSPRLLDSAFHLIKREPLVAFTNWSNQLDIEPRTQSLQLLALGGATFPNSHLAVFFLLQVG